MRLKYARKNYVAYAQIYDDFKGDRSDNIQLLRNLIARYQPNAKTLLDLACGTGSIAQGLAGSFEVVGVDNSPSMLRVAKDKMPAMKLVNAAMTGYELGQKFDVVYCLHNSVNHLTTFSEWKLLFSNVANSLNQGGVFIFDVNSTDKMNQLTEAGAGVKQVGEDYVMTQVIKDTERPERYHWDVKIFLKQRGAKFVMQYERISVSTYPLEQVTRALTKNFDTVESFTLEQADKFEDVGRTYYVCT